MHVNALSNIGLVRKDNEDSYLVSSDRGLFVVADGMGGHLGGQMASTLAIQILDETIRIDQNLLGIEEMLLQALLKANEKIYLQGQDEQYQGMGTTVTAALIAQENIYLAHIGDSRAYLFRENQLSLLTQDHSLVNEMVQQGGLTQEEAEHHPQRNILTRALGTKDHPQVDILKVPVYPGDRLMLCTDGLHNYLRESEMEFILQQDNALQAKVQILVDTALERGGNDNVTVVLVHYE